MSNYILWILLLAIWNVVLFFEKTFGISVMLFMVPLLIFIYIFMKKNDLIRNKSGLLFMIPTLLLSATYGIYDNTTFSVLNFFAIIILLTFTFIYTVKGVEKFKYLFIDTCKLLLFPLTYIGKFFRVSTAKIKEKVKIGDNTKKVLKALLIVVPILLIVITLLSKADMIFGNIFNGLWDKVWDFLESEIFSNFLGRLVTFIVVFFAIGISLMYVLFEYSKQEVDEDKPNNKKRDLFTIKLLVTALDVVYVIFDFIQIKSLMLHSVSSNINYAEYARQGFFELMVVSIINIAVLLICKKFENKTNKKEFKFINIMSVLMVVLTMIIIVSSFLRMNLYENAFGYTTLRLLVYITLITESILMIPTTIYIFKPEVQVFKSYILIILVAYIFANYINIDYMVARKNLDRYYNSKEFDLDYLMNYDTDNISVLVELYKNDKYNEPHRVELSNYLINMKSTLNDERSIFEFNVSRYKAKKLLNETNTLPNIIYEDYPER